MNDLVTRRCVPCEPGMPALPADEVQFLLAQVPAWSLDPERRSISRTFQFKNYYETMAFVNALAWMAHRQDHHPDLEVGYRTCAVHYTTHAAGGLTENDFVCAARIDALLV